MIVFRSLFVFRIVLAEQMLNLEYIIVIIVLEHKYAMQSNAAEKAGLKPNPHIFFNSDYYHT